MAHVSMLLKLFLLEWWQLCCLQMSFICLVDPVSMLEQWKNLSKGKTHQFSYRVPLEGLAPPFGVIHVVVIMVEPFALKTGYGR